MNDFREIITVLVFIACNTVCDANDPNLKISVRNTNYHYGKDGFEISKKYEYEIGVTLELQCGGPEPMYLEWTDTKNDVSQRSCSKTKRLTLKLENLGEDDRDNIFKCSSIDRYNTVRLVLLKNHTDSSKKLQDNKNGSCYEIVREKGKNCSQQLTKDVITRRQISCSTVITGLLWSKNQETNNKTHIQDYSANTNGHSGNIPKFLTYTGVVGLIFITLAIITFCIFKCYKKVKARTINEHIYAEPNAVVYAELQVIDNNPHTLPNRSDPTYAQIVGTLCPARASPE